MARSTKVQYIRLRTGDMAVTRDKSDRLIYERKILASCVLLENNIYMLVVKVTAAQLLLLLLRLDWNYCLYNRVNIYIKSYCARVIRVRFVEFVQ